jgi:hypothetical protein
VFGSSWSDALTTSGTFADFTVVGLPTRQEARGLSFGASIMAGLTALPAMRDGGRGRAWDPVLIKGAPEGVGTFAVQVARTRSAAKSPASAAPGKRGVSQAWLLFGRHPGDRSSGQVGGFSGIVRAHRGRDAVGNESTSLAGKSCNQALSLGSLPARILHGKEGVDGSSPSEGLQKPGKAGLSSRLYLHSL